MTLPWTYWTLVLALLVIHHPYPLYTQESYRHDHRAVDLQCYHGGRTNPSLERCLRRGERFLKRYHRKLYRGRHDLSDTCSSFSGFRSCLQPLLDRCPALVGTLEDDWLEVYHIVNSSCSGNQESLSLLTCFEEQVGGILGRRCEDYYRFNLDQKTRDKCHFFHENVHCKESLVTSACSEDVGRFTFQILRLVAPRHARHGKCSTSRNVQYSGFYYSDGCWSGFPSHVTNCADRHLADASQLFDSQNDLVTQGGMEQIHLACREYEEYQKCIGHLSHNCTKGLELLYGYDGRLRTNVIKLQYICQHRKEYSAHLSCYQDVLANDTLKSCDPIWQILQPMLDDVTAHEFYCNTENTPSQNLTRSLDDLRECYKDVFVTSCGSHGGDVIHGLMLKAFMDPFYLRYEFAPDCELHKRKPNKNKQKYQPKREKKHNIAYNLNTFSTDDNYADNEGNRTVLYQVDCLFLSVLISFGRYFGYFHR